VLLTALAAALSLQIVRAEHIHPAGIEGRNHSLVHSHAPLPVTAGSEWLRDAHGDHRLAIFLVAAGESVLRDAPDRAPDGPAVLAGAPGVAPPLHGVASVHPGSDRPPPRRFVPASPDRAPPPRLSQ
jgi:hypothetical protein